MANGDEPARREQVAEALLNKGVALGALDRPQDEIAVYDELVARFADAPEPAVREQGTEALLNKGVALGALDRPQDEIAVYDELVARFADAPEPAVREQVAEALLNKGVALGALDRPQDEIAVYDELVARFADAPEPALREQVADALFNKSLTLGVLDRPQEEIAAYVDLLARFADAPEPAIGEVVEKARELHSRDVSPLDLRYAIESGLYVVFVPGELVEEILLIRDRLREPITWGEARALLSSRWYDELLDLFVARDERPPPDDRVLEFWEEYDGPSDAWPELTYQEILGWLPDEIINAYGESYEGMVDSGVHMPASLEQEIVQALVAMGFSCEWDGSIVSERLFNYEL